MDETKKESGLMRFMEEKFVPVAAGIGGQRHLLALRDGIVMIMPLLLVGAFAMIIIDFPVPAWNDFMAEIGWYWDGKLDLIVEATFGIMAVIASFGVASSLASSYKMKDGSPVDGIPAGVLAIAAFFIVTEAGRLGAFTEDINIATNAENLFVAMLFAIITAEIYRVFVQNGWIIKMPESVPAAISRQFSALLPGIAVLGGAWLLIAVPFSNTSYLTVSAWLNEGLFSWLVNVGLSYPGIMIGSFLEHLLWCFGLHGSAIIIFPFFEPLYLTTTFPGTEAIVTWPFYENGVWIGGSGATLPAVVYMLLFAKSKLCKDVGRIAIGPGIFNINEPVTFGLPVVLNPVLMIPYILSPLVIITIMYAGTAVGIFPVLDRLVPWTTPIFVSGFLAASGGIGSSIMGLVAQIICFAAAFLIWFPFIRSWDNVNVKREAGEA